jgi:hypothetical protein
VLVFSRWDNFSTNILTIQGASIFSTSLLLFLIGVLAARRVLDKNTLQFGTSELSSAGGREKLLRRLRILHARDSNILRSVSDALFSQGDQHAVRLSRLARFGLFPELSRESSLSPSASKFIDWLWMGLMSHSEKNRECWLQVNQQRIWAEMKVKQVQCAAKINLRLILLMGIFFLPAFFLILWICGTVVSFDNG